MTWIEYLVPPVHTIHPPMKRLLSLVAASLLIHSWNLCAADLKMAAIFTDHMVIQRDHPVPIWGWADPGEKISVEFSGQTKSTTADADGKWLLKLDAVPASGEGKVLVVKSETRANLHLQLLDVLVGEVWLASGQSNMAYGLAAAHDAAAELAKANDTQLRFFTVSRTTAAEPQPDLKGKWAVSTPESAKGFSAVAYFFARSLREKLQCPVAILHSSWGGTAAQTWLSLDALKQEPAFTGYVSRWDTALTKYREVQAHPEWIESYEKDLKQWQAEVAPAFNAAMKEYNALKVKGPKPVPSRPEPSNPDPMAVPSPAARPSTPSVIYNAMIAPLAPFAIRGALWYQGEANGGSGLEYRTLLPRLIGDWRKHWGQGDFPFLVVQLPGWDHATTPPHEHDWPWVREAQLLTSQTVPRTGLAVGIDVGDPRDVHPTGKLDIGLRLAAAARKIAYGESIVHSGPIFRSFSTQGSTLRISFTEIGSGLAISEAPWRANGVEPLPKDKLLGFTIAGDDRVWHEADAKIDGEQVVLSSPNVPKPIAARYGWANAPRCNLYNKEGLPASPFRTDNWPLKSTPAK